jgi:hypothetical protein
VIKTDLGIVTDDLGSRKAILNNVLRLAKNKGVKTSGFHSMKARQLKAIYYRLKFKN